MTQHGSVQADPVLDTPDLSPASDRKAWKAPTLSELSMTGTESSSGLGGDVGVYS